MTWSMNASGHHNTNDWVAEEHELLRKLAAALEADGGATIVTSFAFAGNHIQAHGLAEAREKLAAYGAESAGAGEDDGSTTEPES